MVDYIPMEKGMPIRNPSTANFQINSRDRPVDTSGNYTQPSDNFTISLGQSLLNGFFTRMAVVEVVFDWRIPNVSAAAGNNTFNFTLSTPSIALSTYTATIPTGNYQLLDLADSIAKNMNNVAGVTGIASRYPPSETYTNGSIWETFPPVSVISGPSNSYLQANNTSTPLNRQLGVSTLCLTNTTPVVGGTIGLLNPVVVPLKYVDIICRNLTYNQALKDGTTNKTHNPDVLYRWNLSWDDNGNITDLENNVIYQGYSKFQSRRFLSFPKQINWTPNQPVGTLQFELIGVGELYTPGVGGNLGTTKQINKPLSYWYDQYGGLEWSINCLVSEV
jgi:hypothetical protein